MQKVKIGKKNVKRPKRKRNKKVKIAKNKWQRTKQLIVRYFAIGQVVCRPQKSLIVFTSGNAIETGSGTGENGENLMKE